MKLEKRQIYFITIGCFLSYFLFGFMDNMKGPTLPYILAEGEYNYSAGGTIIFSEYTGFFIATFISGVFSDWFGKKFTLIMAGCCLILGVIGYAVSSELVLLIGFIFPIGLGLGSLELSGSNIISSIYDQNRGRYLNLLNAFYGIGSIITPVLVGNLLNFQISWRRIYQYSLIIIIPITMYFILMKYPKEETTRKQKEKFDFRQLVQIIFQKEYLLMYVIIFAYVATEIGVATWLVEFLQKAKQVSVVTSSTLLSLHFIGMTIGRLLGSLFVDKIGHLKSLLIFTMIAIVCMAVGIFGGNAIAFVLAFTGFGFSIIFPTATTVVSELSDNHSGTMLGLFFAFGGLGGMIGPWLIGIVNDAFGLKMGMSVNLLFCITIVIALVILMSLRQEKEKDSVLK